MAQAGLVLFKHPPLLALEEIAQDSVSVRDPLNFQVWGIF